MVFYYIDGYRINHCLKAKMECSHRHYYFLANCFHSLMERINFTYHINENYVIEPCIDQSCTIDMHFSNSRDVVKHHRNNYDFNGVWRPLDNQYSSLMEEEVNFMITLMGYRTIRHSRSIISPYEIDIYIPKRNIAIEINGDYWHSSEMIERRYKKKPYDYHYDKFVQCDEIGVKLAYIWESNFKQDRILFYDMLCDLIQFKRENKLLECFDRPALPEKIFWESTDRVSIQKHRIKLEKRYRKKYGYR